MNPANRQIPDKPGFNGPEEKTPFTGQMPGLGNVIENPSYLGSAEVWVDNQSGLFSHCTFKPRVYKVTAEFCCPSTTISESRLW